MVPAALCFGLAVFLAMQRSVWALVPALQALALAIGLEVTRRRRPVRAALKQPVRPDPPFSWRLVALYLAAYALVLAVPKGNVLVLAVVGCVATAATLAAGWTSRPR